jgi:hypothetical protein
VDEIARVARDRRERVVVHLAAGDDRHRLVEKADERAQDARLRLTAQAEQDEVVSRQDRVDDLRHDRLLIADHAGEERAAAGEAREQVLAHLVLDRPRGAVGSAEWRALEGAQGFRIRRH